MSDESRLVAVRDVLAAGAADIETADGQEVKLAVAVSTLSRAIEAAGGRPPLSSTERMRLLGDALQARRAASRTAPRFPRASA